MILLATARDTVASEDLGNCQEDLDENPRISDYQKAKNEEGVGRPHSLSPKRPARRRVEGGVRKFHSGKLRQGAPAIQAP